jgi:hypothetical protein
MSASVCTTIWRRLCGAHPHCDFISCRCVCREMRKCDFGGRQIAAALDDLAMPSCRYRAVRVSRT